MRGGGSQEEAACQLYQEAIQLHNEDLCPLATKMEALVVETIQDKNRQEQSGENLLGKLKAMHNIDPLMSEFKATMEKTDALMSKLAELCQVESSNVRKTNFYRAKHALTHAEKKKTQLQQLIRRFIEMVLQIVGGRNTSTIEGPHATDWLYALECVDSFNKMVATDQSLADSTIESEKANSSIHSSSQQLKHVNENFTPSFHQTLRQISSSQVLQLLAHERSWLAALEVTKAIVIHLERKQLLIATEEVSWLGIPMSSIDGNAGGQAYNFDAISIYPVIRSNSSSSPAADNIEVASAAANGTGNADSKNKDGNGNKRKNRRSPTDSLTSGDVRTNASPQSHFKSMEDFVAHEEIFLNGVFNVISQVSGLLSKAVLRPAKSGSGERISKTVKQRMAEYYHDMLWQNVGELAQQSVLWYDLPGYVHLPFALQHPRVCLGLANIIQDNMYSQPGEGYPPLVFPTMHLMVEALNMHVITVSWDLQYLTCLAESSRAKLKAIEVTEMNSGTTVSQPGNLFYDTLKSITRLNNRCHPDELRDFVEHGSHDPEEFPFMEEQSILRRLEATLFTLRNWSVTKSKAAVNNWHVRDFVLITQGDLLNTQDCYTLLQLSSHDKLVNSKAFNIQLFTHIQSFLAKEIKDCQRNLKSLPDKNLNDLSQVCRTFSLATLKNIFPPSSHFTKGGNTSNISPSGYVAEYIDRVLAPVVEALIPMRAETQQNVARITLKTFCEAWLEHIRGRRMKFSDHGAIQLSTDFGSLRTWISNNETLKEESRRYLLLLDSIRQCEGVARLLLSRPGDLVDIKPAKNKVAPIDSAAGKEQRPQSPVNQILEAIPAELYVPNQQQWISLKSGSKMATIPFCCR